MTPDFSKSADGLVPAIIQDAESAAVLMLGYMNAESFARTVESGMVWFYSRSRHQLWLKGESSGNILDLVDVALDCDQDTVLVRARPRGPVCHTGARTCFGDEPASSFLPALERTIAQRRTSGDEASYVAGLFRKGINAIAQKVGEEAVELIIEAKDDDDVRFRDEAADLLFHYLILLQAKGCSLKDIESVLANRSR